MESFLPTDSERAASRADILRGFEVCPTCYEHVRRNTLPGGHVTDREMDEWYRHTLTSSCLKFGKTRTHVGNGKPSGPFAFTLTKSDKDPLTVGDMLTSVRKVMSQKSCPVIKYAWYYEDKGRDANGDAIHPHIHGLYETETGGRIERKHWKRAWSIWDETKPMGSGFRGGYHRPVKHNEAYADYMAKDGGMSESFGI